MDFMLLNKVIFYLPQPQYVSELKHIFNMLDKNTYRFDEDGNCFGVECTDGQITLSSQNTFYDTERTYTYRKSGIILNIITGYIYSDFSYKDRCIFKKMFSKYN
jgi:hypothetical protein